MTGRKKILVTGGAGYIGSHTCVSLAEHGYLPVIADNFSNADRSVPARLRKLTGLEIPVAEADLTDKKAVTGIFEDLGPFTAVLHFAALKSVSESVQKPFEYYRNNIVSLLNILGQIRQGGIMVFSSSCTVYGEPEQLPVTENTPFGKPSSPYGETKQICERILAGSAAAEGIASVCLRYFNPIGAHDSALIGEFPSGIPDNLLPYLTGAVAGKLNNLKVFGNDYDTPDGTCIRDYIHVCDLAEAHVSALDKLISDPAPRNMSYNIGTGTGYSVLEIIRAFEEVNQVKVPYSIAPRRPGDIAAIWSDSTLANKELNWSARRTLNDMVKSTWQWELQLKEIYG